jgi:hypothetical protein
MEPDRRPGSLMVVISGAPMQLMEGIVTIVQEGRFCLTDQDGVSHHFELSHSAAAEPDQLPPLQKQQARVRVSYEPGENVIGFIATRIDRLDR